MSEEAPDLKSINEKCTYWVFTINNPKDRWEGDLGEALTNVFNKHPEVLRAVWQLEQGEKETPHIQGYLELDSKKRKRRKEMAKILPDAYLAPRYKNSSEHKARQYCMKEKGRLEGPWEYGDWKAAGQGRRKDIATYLKAVDNDATELDLAQNPETQQTWADYKDLHTRWKNLKQPNKNWETEVEIHIGDPGTGKTKTIKRDYPQAFWKTNNKWWDRYNSEHVVVLDEFVGWLQYNELLRLCDDTDVDLEVKGSFKRWNAKKLILISNNPPWDWYEESKKKNKEALYRRIKSIWWHQKGVAPVQFTDWNVFVKWWASTQQTDSNWNYKQHLIKEMIKEWEQLPPNKEVLEWLQIREAKKIIKKRKIIKEAEAERRAQQYMNDCNEYKQNNNKMYDI